MKKLLCLAISFMMTFVMFSSGVTTFVNAEEASGNGPYVNWMLDDGSGAAAIDSSENNRTALLYNDPVWQTVSSSVYGGCLSFDGINQYGSAPLDLSDTDIVTVAFWMNVSSFSSGDNLAFEFGASSQGINNLTTGFMINPNSSQGGGSKFEVGLRGDGGYNQILFDRPSTDSWHHYAFVFDKGAAAADEVTAYVDGVPVSYTKLTNTENSNNFGNDTLFIMSRNGTSHFNSGMLDNISIYKRALSSTEIEGLVAEDYVPAESIDITEDNLKMDIGESETLAATILPENTTNKTLVWFSTNPSVAAVDVNGTVTAVSEGMAIITARVIGTEIEDTCTITVGFPDLVAEYMFSGNMDDSSGNGYNGSSTNPPVLIEDRYGNENSAYYFTPGQRIDLGDYTDFGTGNFTAALWFKSDNIPANGICQLIGKTDDPYAIQSPGRGYFIGLRDFSGVKKVVAQVCGSTGTRDFGIPIDEQQWHFVALVKNTGNILLYLDGEITNFNNTIGDNSCPGYQTSLGRDPTTGQWSYGGSMDDVRIYDEALTTDQLDALYTVGMIIEPQVPTHSVIVSAIPSEGGTASGGGTYAEGDPVAVTAAANSGYTFVNWTENGVPVSAQALYTFTMGTSDRTLEANFTSGQPGGHTYWVSPEGQASWNAARSETPLSGEQCTSIAIANSNAVAGDTVYIRGGDYVCDEFVKPANSGASWDHQIVYSAYNEEKVTVTNQFCPNRSHEDEAWAAVNGATVEHSTDEAFDGDYSTKFTVTGGLQGVESGPITVRGNAWMAFSSWIWSDQSSVDICVMNSNGVSVNKRYQITPYRWTMIRAHESDFPSFAINGQVNIAFRSPDDSTTGTWYVDNVRVQSYVAGIHLDNRDYIKVHGIDFVACFGGFTIRNGSDNNEISYCSFTDLNAEYNFSMNCIWNAGGAASNYNWIHHCSIFENGLVMDGDDIGSGLQIGQITKDDSSHNLVENCIFRHNGHDNLAVLTKNNVIRNNWFVNDGWMRNHMYEQGGWPSGSGGNNNPLLFGNRNVAFLDVANNAGYNLVEGNRMGYGAVAPDDDAAYGFENDSDGNIVRYNSIYGNGSSGIYFKTVAGSQADNNRIYNNTVYANGGDEEVTPRYYGGINMRDSAPKGNVIKNNIVFDNITAEYGSQYCGGDDRLLYEENTYTGNLENDPGFVNPDLTDKYSLILPDLTLRPSSSAIDSGEALTAVAATDAGTGTSLVVEDASYFQDGSWAPAGKVQPDWIAVGSVDNVVKIISIDFETDTITLEQSIDRSVSDSVWLYKDSSGNVVLHGSAPDVGAYEFTGIKENLAPVIKMTAPATIHGCLIGSDVNVTVAVSDDQEVVKVEYYMDGIKVGESTEAPFGFVIQDIQQGNHELYCIAYDAEGLFTKSEESTIIVHDQNSVVVKDGAWVNIPVEPLSGIAIASFDVIPLVDNMNAIVGITKGEARAYADMAISVGFNDSYIINAINGAAYKAENALYYTPYKTNRVEITADVTKHTYSATFTDWEGNTRLLARDYSFRTPFSNVTELNNILFNVGYGAVLISGYSIEELIIAESVDITEEQVELDDIGASITLTATVLPEDTTNKNLVWTSSDSSVVTVDTNGKVTAISAGTATITVRVAGTQIEDTCTVTVASAAPPSATLKGPFVENGQYKLTYGLQGAVGIKAQDVTVSYDKNLFNFVNTAPVPGSGTTIAPDSIINDTDAGTVSFILANLGQGNAVNGDADILDIIFMYKASGTGTIAVTSVQLANSAGEEDIFAETAEAAKTIEILYGREALISAIIAAEEICENAEIGIQTGKYPASAKVRLDAAITAAAVVRDDVNATESQVLQAIADLNAAVTKFQSLIITDTTGDFNDTPGIGLGDLAIIAENYGKTSGSEGSGWDAIKGYDIDGDGEIGLYEFAFIARRMILG